MRFVVQDCGFLWILIFYFVYKEESPSRREICCPGLLVFMDFDILFVYKEESPSRGEICCPGLWVFLNFDTLFCMQRGVAIT